MKFVLCSVNALKFVEIQESVVKTFFSLGLVDQAEGKLRISHPELPPTLDSD